MKEYKPSVIPDVIGAISETVWEQRRYETAKELLKHIYTFSLNTIQKHGLPEEYQDLGHAECERKLIKSITDDAVFIADALILRLRQH